MFHLFQTYVASVLSRCLNVDLDIAFIAMATYICCKCMFQIFQLFQTYVARVLCGCSICFTSYTHMLQASIKNVSSISDVRCKCVYLNVAVTIHIYVTNVCL